MDASGSAVQAASPRALITNHLNGQATCTDYESFAMETPSPLPWLTSYLFQSGHALSPNGQAGTVCPGYLSSDPSPVAAAMRRVIVLFGRKIVLVILLVLVLEIGGSRRRRTGRRTTQSPMRRSKPPMWRTTSPMWRTKPAMWT